MNRTLIVGAAAVVVSAGFFFSTASGSDTSTMESATIPIGKNTLEVTFAAGSTDLSREALLCWVTRAGEAVAAYYGHLPVPNAKIRVVPVSGRSGVFNGTTWGSNGGFTKISVGQHTSQQQLDDDWMMTHELVHMTFPDVDDSHHWIEEGIATYVEPIARVEAGQLSGSRAWADMAKSMPQGEPESGDRGLDVTHTWGRTYWGGALFCLKADVSIRRCTQNRKGLQDALRGILDHGGAITESWPIENVWKAGDAATGCTVLADLYREWKNRPVEVDLGEIWKNLGVVPNGPRSVLLVNDGPWADTRRAILPEAGYTK